MTTPPSSPFYTQYLTQRTLDEQLYIVEVQHSKLMKYNQTQALLWIINIGATMLAIWNVVHTAEVLLLAAWFVLSSICFSLFYKRDLRLLNELFDGVK